MLTGRRGVASELAHSLTLISPHIHMQSLTPARAHISLVLHRKKRIGENSTFYGVHLATLALTWVYLYVIEPTHPILGSSHLF